MSNPSRRARRIVSVCSACLLCVSAGCLSTPTDPKSPEGGARNKHDENAPPEIIEEMAKSDPRTVRIVSGPDSIQTLESETATFGCDHVDEDIVSHAWSLEWWNASVHGLRTGSGTDPSVTIDSLDEGQHTFRVAGIYGNGVTTPPDSIESWRFNVQAVTSPKMYLSPRMATVSRDTSFSVVLRAGALQGSVKGFRVVIVLPDGLEFDALTTASTDSAEILVPAALDQQVLKLWKTSDGGRTGTLEVILVGDPPFTVDGGEIARFRLRATRFGRHKVELRSCLAFDDQNVQLPSLKPRDMIVEVK